jgi:hypothetical protein
MRNSKPVSKPRLFNRSTRQATGNRLRTGIDFFRLAYRVLLGERQYSPPPPPLPPLPLQLPQGRHRLFDDRNPDMETPADAARISGGDQFSLALSYSVCGGRVAQSECRS